MEFNRQNIHSKATSAETHVIDEGLRAYMLKVYNCLLYTSDAADE